MLQRLQLTDLRIEKKSPPSGGLFFYDDQVGSEIILEVDSGIDIASQIGVAQANKLVGG